MKTPSSSSNVPTPPSSGRTWSKSLKSQTREALEECRINPITQKLHFKNTNNSFGHITFQDLLDGRLTIHCEESEDCFTAESVEDLLAAGWAID